MRVVIDSNVLVSSALSNKGAPARIFEKFRDGGFELVVTAEILAEYRRALSHGHVRKLHGLTTVEIADLIDQLAKTSVLVDTPGEMAPISADPDDDKFLYSAYAGAADYIISGDKYLLNVQQYEGIRILSPTAFIMMLNQEEQQPE